MRKTWMLSLMIVLITSIYISAKEPILTQHWLIVKAKTKIYPDYSLSKSKTMLNPGKYLIVAEGDIYYQLGDSIYLKQEKTMSTFKVAYTPESNAASDTIEQHRQNIDQKIQAQNAISPFAFILFALVLILMIIGFYVN